MRIALLHHEHGAPTPATAAADRIASSLAAAGQDARVVRPGRELPDAPLRLRKIGDRPGRLPASLWALVAGRFDVAHAFTAQDAVAAVVWSRLVGRPALFSACEPLRRAALADRRLRLAQLRLAVEGSDAVVAFEPEVADSLRSWMAVEPRLVPRGSVEELLALYGELGRR